MSKEPHGNGWRAHLELAHVNIVGEGQSDDTASKPRACAPEPPCDWWTVTVSSSRRGMERCEVAFRPS